MVSAAVAWVAPRGPELTGYQAAQVVRLGARDVGKPGWEDSTGFGVLSMPGALARPAPADDPPSPTTTCARQRARAGQAAPPLFTRAHGRR